MRNKVVKFWCGWKKKTVEQQCQQRLFWGPIVHPDPSAAQMPSGISLPNGIPLTFEAQCPLDDPVPTGATLPLFLSFKPFEAC